MKPIAVVTGGAGFIGSHMVDLLIKQGFYVNIIDSFIGGSKKNLKHLENNSRIKVWDEDIRDLKSDHEAFNHVDYVFHFAGIGDIVPSISKPIDYLDVNVLGTSRVLECSRIAKVKKFVYAASSSCYGLAAVPTDECHKIEPMYPYALSKYQGEQAAFHWYRVYGLPVNSICIFNAYGPRVKTNGAYGAVFGVFLKQFLEHKPLTLVGDGTQKRDFIYVTDVARAFLEAAKTPENGQRYNVGAGNPQTIKYLIELIGGEYINLPKRGGEPEITYANINKIKNKLNWEPVVSFEEGVSKMLSNIKDWKDAPLWDVKKIEEATKVWFQYMDVGNKK
tara:strand:- start:809 stop:1810 length:1002 start_codon:yes stop_codon:yes gene_type:complete